MTTTQALMVGGVVLVAIFCRAYHYRQVFGRWVWFRLRPEEAARLLPRDPSSAFKRGYREGEVAARREIVAAIRERYCDTSKGVYCSDFRAAADFVEAEFGERRTA